MRLCVHVVMVWVFVVLGSAQQALNNDAVIKMVKAGLPEDVVVATIQQQPGNFSVSPDDLIALKTAGVPDKILAAMVAKGAAKPAPVRKDDGSALSSKGVVLAGASGNPKHIQDVLDGLKDRLTKIGVDVIIIENKSRTEILEQVRSSGGSLLWVTVDVAVGQLKDKVRAQYFDALGNKVWEEEASGGIFNFSGSGATNNMIKNIFRKIEPHFKGKKLDK